MKSPDTIHSLHDVPWHRQLRVRLTLSFVLMSLVPGFVIGTVSYIRSAATIESQAARLFSTVLSTTREQILAQFQRIESTSEQIAALPEVREILARAMAGYDDLEAQLDDYYALSRLLQAYERPSEIHRVRLMVRGEALYIAERNNLFPLDESLLDSRGEPRTWWTGVRDYTYLYQDSRRVLTYSRVITSWYDFRDVIGVLSIDVPESAISGSLPLSVDQSEAVVLFSDSDFITRAIDVDAASVLPVVAGLDTSELAADTLSEVIIADAPYLAMALDLGFRSWRLAAFVRADQLYGESVALRRFVAVFLGLLLAFSTLVATSLAGILSRRLHALSVGMSEVVEGNYGATLTVAGHDEISVLQRNFNEMTTRIQQLIHEVYTTTIQLQAAELRALEGHITPHFLYNTLDAIKWQAKRAGAEGIVKMSGALSRYFRISLSKGRERITLAEEFDLLESYVELQNIRFDNSIDYQGEMAPEIGSIEVIKFVLQPLVENSITHGFAPRGRNGGTIRVRADRQGEDLLLSVSDDGVGIPADLIDMVALDPTNGYGLWNVSQRIRLYYGDGYGIEISSQAGIGTEVTVRLAVSPVRRLGAGT